MAVTLRDVARAADVSVATASRALGDSRLVNPKTVRHVVQVAAALGYRTNTFARALKTKRSKLIGLTVHNLENESFRVLASVVQTRMQAQGYQVLLTISGDDAEQEKEILNTLKDHGVDALITVPTGANGAELLAMEQAGIPVVCAVRRVLDVALEAVLAADTDGGYEGTRHLLVQGHRRIGLIVGLTSTTSGKERLAGYRRALEEGGLPFEPGLVHAGRYTPVTGSEGAHALLDLPQAPTALFVANHESSLGVLRAVAERGLDVPKDLSLLFYEDSPWLEWQRPAMSVVDSAATDLANLVVDRLVQRLAGVPNSAREYRVGSRLVQRASIQSPST